MRIKAVIKLALKQNLSGWKKILLMFAIFPLIIAVFLGQVQKDIFKPDANRDKINITIIDKDNTKTSEYFKELFETEELKEIFNVTDKSQYEIILPKGYENNISNLKEDTIIINEKKRVSRTNELIIRSVIEQYGKSLAETKIISNKIDNMSGAVDKEKLFNQVINSINKNASEASISQNIIKGERTLTSYENQAATLMTLMVFSVIMGCIELYDLDKKKGNTKRLLSTPITKEGFFNLQLVYFFTSSLIYGIVYILAFRITGLAFKGINILVMAVILICQSLLIAASSGIIVVFFGKRTGTIMVSILMYIYLIFGGGFIALKDMHNKIFLTISKFAPGNVISEAYKNCILLNSFDNIIKYLIIMLLTALVLYVISISKVKISWEE